MGPITLEYAIYWSPVPFIRALLDLRTDPNYGDPGAIAILLKAGADPSARTRIDELETALESAERANSLEAIRALKSLQKP
jgi:hypothetical protein